MRRMLIGLKLFPLVAALAVLVAFGSSDQNSSAPRTQAPRRDRESINETLRSVGIQPYTGSEARIDFELTNLADRSRSLADYRSKVLLLNFWATWCPPCIEEMPSMQRLSEELSVEGLALVAVNMQETRDAVQPFVEELGLTFEILLDRRGGTGQAYGVRGLPTTVLLDREGRVLGTKLGFALWDDPRIIDALRIVLREL